MGDEIGIVFIYTHICNYVNLLFRANRKVAEGSVLLRIGFFRRAAVSWREIFFHCCPATHQCWPKTTHFLILSATSAVQCLTDNHQGLPFHGAPAATLC
jgi:hypothetical protein